MRQRHSRAQAESKPGDRSTFNVQRSTPLPSLEMSPSDGGVQPVVDSMAVFKDGLFKNRVLFCTGGGSGICRVMTEAVVS